MDFLVYLDRKVKKESQEIWVYQVLQEKMYVILRIGPEKTTDLSQVTDKHNVVSSINIQINQKQSVHHS
jgi:hypothetical protein